MAKRDPQRTLKLRIAVGYLLDHHCFEKGNQTRLAEHFRVSRQRVHQIVVEERRRRIAAQTSAAPSPAPSAQSEPQSVPVAAAS